MPDEWNTNAPDINSDFNQAEQAQEPAPEINQEPVTSAELDGLQEQREEQQPAPELTIGGQREQTVHEDINQEREGRIDYIEERLGKMDNKARDDFNMTQQEQDQKEMEEDQGMSF